MIQPLRGLLAVIRNMARNLSAPTVTEVDQITSALSETQQVSDESAGVRTVTRDDSQSQPPEG